MVTAKWCNKWFQLPYSSHVTLSSRIQRNSLSFKLEPLLIFRSRNHPKSSHASLSSLKNAPLQVMPQNSKFPYFSSQPDSSQIKCHRNAIFQARFQPDSCWLHGIKSHQRYRRSPEDRTRPRHPPGHPGSAAWA